MSEAISSSQIQEGQESGSVVEGASTGSGKDKTGEEEGESESIAGAEAGSTTDSIVSVVETEAKKDQSRHSSYKSEISRSSPDTSSSSAIVDEVELILEETTSLLSELNQPKLIRVENLSESLEEISDELIWKSEDNISMMNLVKKQDKEEQSSILKASLHNNLYRVKNISKNLNIQEVEDDEDVDECETEREVGGVARGGTRYQEAGGSSSFTRSKKNKLLNITKTIPTPLNYSKLSLPNLSYYSYDKKSRQKHGGGDGSPSSSSSSTIDLIDDSEISLRSTIDLLLNDDNKTTSLNDIYPYQRTTIMKKRSKKVKFCSQWNLSSRLLYGGDGSRDQDFLSAASFLERQSKQQQPFLARKISDLRTVRYLKAILPNHSIEIVELVHLNELGQSLDVRFKNELFRISFNKVVFAWK